MGLMRSGHKAARETVYNDPFVKDHYLVFLEGRLRKVICENELICPVCLTDGDFMADDWCLYQEEK